ncbi:MAG TPA: flagellar hook-basal body complex protein FliE [Candidatus Bathyarchaeota archaeon]|nr:flagellar hook-basal body complex protein FliE [Candidatus Bathyarchaeota archaeon]
MNCGEKGLPSKKVVGIAGMPGAGKTLAAKIAKEMNFEVVVMGDIVREEAKKRGLAPNPENLGKLMLQMREKEGPAVIAKKCIPKIEEAKTDIVIVDGVRSLHEVKEFRRFFPNFIILAVHASPKTRFERLFKRKRSDDPEKWATFLERDMRELKVGLGHVIALADQLIVNEGSKAEFEEKVRDFLRKVIKDG